MNSTLAPKAPLNTDKTYTSDELLGYFDSLEPVTSDFMLGQWQGEVLLTGHPGESQLLGLKWVGKSFHAANDVEPIISQNSAGERYTNPILGTASLREVCFRGKCTATMVYDSHPIFDHFAKIDDNHVLGVMDKKGDTQYLFFTLARLP
ncbi:DUF4334 domain-containing protein [Halioxenophilus sp. WMMB6]|uniref:DUF4334 domain-containing protein n=1 Tax=Halioxenophilus sp. WMMB6 TaxID=3073815 RepID=UPI00295E3981|nr:DUF4334 domain-containing protein [Halioxenophilus sp. WMMB6]